jgi:hypothetical protein
MSLRRISGGRVGVAISGTTGNAFGISDEATACRPTAERAQPPSAVFSAAISFTGASPLAGRPRGSTAET